MMVDIETNDSDEIICQAEVMKVATRKALIDINECDPAKITTGLFVRLSSDDLSDFDKATNTPTAPKTSVQAKNHGRYHLGLIYSQADQAEYEGSTDVFGSDTPFTATEKSEPALGFSAGYIYRKPRSIGFSGGVSFEMPRESKGLKGQLGGTGFTGQYEGSAPEINLVTLDANVNYSINSSYFLFAGGNFPIVITSEDSVDFEGLFGYQYGVGRQFLDRFVLDLSYRQVRMKGIVSNSGRKLEIENAEFSGLVIGLRYLW